MHTARVTTGMALVGAGVMAVAPITPITSPPPAMPTAISTVRLAAAPAPFDFYREVAQRTLFFTASLTQSYFSDPLPISRAVIDNQVAAVSNIIAAVGSGDPAAVLAALGEAVTQPIENAIAAAGVVGDLSWVMAVSAVSPALQLVASTEYALRDVFAAAASVDLIGLVNSVLDIPAHVANGVLNGGYPFGTPFNPVVAGFLTPAGFLLSIGGPFALLIVLDQRVAQAISPESAGRRSRGRGAGSLTATPPHQPPGSGAATHRLNTAAPVDESGPPQPAPETAEPDIFGRTGQGLAADREASDAPVEAEAAAGADTAAESAAGADTAVDADTAAQAHAAPGAPGPHRAARHGHRAGSATASK